MTGNLCPSLTRNGKWTTFKPQSLSFITHLAQRLFHMWTAEARDQNLWARSLTTAVENIHFYNTQYYLLLLIAIFVLQHCDFDIEMWQIISFAAIYKLSQVQRATNNKCHFRGKWGMNINKINKIKWQYLNLVYASIWYVSIICDLLSESYYLDTKDLIILKPQQT